MSNVLTKRYGPFDSLMLMGWSSLLTVPQVMLMSLLLEYGQLASLVTADERGWLALAYTIFIGGIVGFGLWFWLIARCSMGRVAPFGLLLPVFALISSVLFLGDRRDLKADCRWTARDLRRRHYTSKTERSTNLNTADSLRALICGAGVAEHTSDARCGLTQSTTCRSIAARPGGGRAG